MGFRHGIVLSAVGFLFGVLFISFNTDYRLLWVQPTQQSVSSAINYYTTFYNAPKAVLNLLHAVIGVGLVGLIGKLHKWDESAMFFDGSALAAYVFAIMLYMTVVIPGIKSVVPTNSVETALSDEEKLQALQVLAAGNTLIAGCLGLVLALLAGQEYARRADEKVSNATLHEETSPAVPSSDAKKTD